jgi:hypothetical protein
MILDLLDVLAVAVVFIVGEIAFRRYLRRRYGSRQD